MKTYNVDTSRGAGQGAPRASSEVEVEAAARGTLALAKAWVWVRLGQRERALRVLDRAVARGAQVEVHRNRASLLALLGRREEALEAYRGALRVDPLDGMTRLKVLETLASWGWDKERVLAFMDEVCGDRGEAGSR